MSSRVQKNSVQTETYLAIRSAIVEGTLVPGQKVTNRLLADLVGVSVTPVREALRRLVAEGALLELPNGSVMAPHADAVGYLNEIAWVLKALETQLAARASERLGAADLAFLEAVAEASEVARGAEDAHRVLALWRDFCSRVFDRAGAPVTASIVQQLWVRAASVLRPAYPSFDRSTDGRHISALLSALKARDPKGAASAVAELHDCLAAEIARRNSFGAERTAETDERKGRKRRRQLREVPAGEARSLGKSERE